MPVVISHLLGSSVRSRSGYRDLFGSISRRLTIPYREVGIALGSILDEQSPVEPGVFPSGHPELAEEAVNVVLHGPQSDPQSTGDLLIAPSTGDVVENFPLPRAQGGSSGG